MVDQNFVLHLLVRQKIGSSGNRQNKKTIRNQSHTTAATRTKSTFGEFPIGKGQLLEISWSTFDHHFFSF
jgi:hypothetical protein